MQSLHRVRERWVMRRTAIVNQIRGLLRERGITLRKGRTHVDAALPGILEDADSKLSGALCVLLAQLKLELDQMAIRIDEADEVLNKTARENEACQRLTAIPGVGPITATALIAASVTEGPSARSASSRPGWVWFRESIQPAASRSSSESANMEIPTELSTWRRCVLNGECIGHTCCNPEHLRPRTSRRRAPLSIPQGSRLAPVIPAHLPGAPAAGIGGCRSA
jgi:hypothetical protein